MNGYKNFCFRVFVPRWRKRILFIFLFSLSALSLPPNAALAQDRIPDSDSDILHKITDSMYQFMRDLKEQLNRIEKWTVQKRFLGQIDKKTPLSLQLASGVSLEMVYVKAGKFLMGTDKKEIDKLILKTKTYEIEKESPVHTVIVPEFYIGKYEITNKQYALFLKERKRKGLRKQRDNPDWESMPVVNVAWKDAVEFTKWLSSRLLLNVRLPTEEEWEWAARGPENRRYPWGDKEPGQRKGYGLWGDSYGRPQKVGLSHKGKSWCGAYDMAGNVCELMFNSFYSYEKNIPPSSRKTYVARGGSFASKLFDVRSASRFELFPDIKKPYLGFRIMISFEE